MDKITGIFSKTQSRPHPQTIKSQLLGVGHGQECFLKLHSRYQCADKFGERWARKMRHGCWTALRSRSEVMLLTKSPVVRVSLHTSFSGMYVLKERVIG